MTETKLYRGTDLLDKIFDFTAMVPNPEEWNLNALKSNPPRYIRLQQINALINAFFGQLPKTSLLEKTKALFTPKNPLTIQFVLSGDFLKEREAADNTGLIIFIKHLVKEKEGVVDEGMSVHPMKLVIPYQQLIKYKQLLISLLSFNSGWLEAGSITSRFSIYLTNSISINLVDKYDELNKALELFINPGNLSFTEDELKKKYNFPLDDLNAVDMEFY